MKVTSATLITLVSVLGSIAASLSGSTNPSVAIAGLVLSSIYAIVHGVVTVNAQNNAAAAAPSLPPFLDSGHVPVLPAAAPVPVSAPVVAPAPTPAPAAPIAQLNESGNVPVPPAYPSAT